MKTELENSARENKKDVGYWRELFPESISNSGHPIVPPSEKSEDGPGRVDSGGTVWRGF